MAKHSGVWLVFLASAFLAGPVVCDYEALLHEDQKAWQKAREACIDVQNMCDLAVRDTSDHKFWDSLGLASGAQYWIGAKVHNNLLWKESKRPLIQSEGCYEVPRDLSSSTFLRPIKYNNPERCLTECSTGMVALQNTTCFCLSAGTLATFSRRPVEECYLYCPRDHYRCGGSNRLSVYKMPERTLFEKRGKSEKFYWQLASNNENQFILITNKQDKNAQTGVYCATETGSYQSRDVSSGCPNGSKEVTFENMDVGAFAQVVSTSASSFDDYSASLVYLQQPTWLDGTVISGLNSEGECIALKRQDNQYLLEQCRCKLKLPPICACYKESAESQTTSSFTSTPVSRPGTDVTSSAPVERTAHQTSTTMAKVSTATYITLMSEAPSKTTKNVVSIATESQSNPGASGTSDTGTPGFSSIAVPSISSNATSQPTATNLTAWELGGGGVQFAPESPVEGAARDAGHGTASVPTGMIAGIAAGCAALLVIAIFVAVIIRRKSRASSQPLVKRDKHGHVNYPI